MNNNKRGSDMSKNGPPYNKPVPKLQVQAATPLPANSNRAMASGTFKTPAVPSSVAGDKSARMKLPKIVPTTPRQGGESEMATVVEDNDGFRRPIGPPPGLTRIDRPLKQGR